jgi:hypothetical protein
MTIRFTKKEHRCQLTYQRHDGEMLLADLGPDLPSHDLAHFVMEQILGMKTGFYGNLYAGYSMEQLGDKYVIRQLPVETMIAEVGTRALQSLAGSACKPEEFNELINMELSGMSTDYRINLSPVEITQLRNDYRHLISQWNALPMGGTLELEMQFD